MDNAIEKHSALKDRSSPIKNPGVESAAARCVILLGCGLEPFVPIDFKLFGTDVF